MSLSAPPPSPLSTLEYSEAVDEAHLSLLEYLCINRHHHRTASTPSSTRSYTVVRSEVVSNTRNLLQYFAQLQANIHDSLIYTTKLFLYISPVLSHSCIWQNHANANTLPSIELPISARPFLSRYGPYILGPVFVNDLSKPSCTCWSYYSPGLPQKREPPIQKAGHSLFYPSVVRLRLSTTLGGSNPKESVSN